MGDKRISHSIVEACKRIGIDYASINPNYTNFYSDAKQLGKIYRDLKILAGELEEICERHKIDKLSKLLHDDILKIERVEHDLVKVAHKLQKEEKNERKN